MPSKSTSKTTNSLAVIQLIITLLMILTIVSAQPECISRAFPGVLPLRLNENLLINLEEYFEGSNLTFNVQPNNTHSYIVNTFECRGINEQRVGKVVNTRYLSVSNEQIIATLIESLITPGAYSVQLFKMKELTTTIINLPFGTINNCSHFAVKIINSTHFELTVDCRYTKKLYTKNLLTTIAKFGSPLSDWQLFEAPLFTYNSNMDTRLQLYNDALIRGVYSPTNSYIEIWSWNDDAHQLQGVIDKTFLEIDAFYLKSMQLYGNMLVLLDYYTGLHFIKVTNQRTFAVIGQFLQPFYQIFEYNPATGLVYLGKKGKIVSATLRLNSISPLTGQSYNIYKYEKIHKIISAESYLIVLGQTMINIFRISVTTSDSKHFSLYQSKGAVEIIFENNAGQLARLLVIRNQSPLLSFVSCTIKTSYLYLNTPQLAHQVKITGTSIMQGRSSSCEQSFSIQRLTTEKDFIYDNGFQTDNQILFANMPGEGLIELGKYGLARNLSYKVTPSQTSKIDYEAKINKITQVACTMDEKKISNGGDMYLTKTCDRLLIVQFSSDYTLRYYLCSSSAPINCKYILDLTNMLPIDHGAHQIIQKNQKNTTIFQAFVQQKQQNVTILIKKLIIDQVGNNVQFTNQCKIFLVNNTLKAGNITQLEIFNGRLYVVMPLRKEIVIYDLFTEGCPAIIALNVQTCPFGYFAPRSIVFDQSKSQTRQQLIMVQQWDEVLTIRLEGAYPHIKPVLLGRNNLPEAVNTTIVVSFPYLIYFSKTKNRAFTYLFDDSHNLIYLRQILLSNRTFKSSSPKRSDFAKLLDADHIALSLYNNISGQSSLSVYKFNQLISVTQQYFIVQMRKQQQFVFLPTKKQNSLIAMSLELIPSPATQYLICKTKQTSLVPSVSLKFKQSRITLQEYSENVTLVLNSAHAQITHIFKLSLSNIGNTIKRGSSFPSRGTTVQAQPDIIINDNNWFTGSIFDYDYTCQDCGSRIIFKRKATLDDRQILPVPRNQFWIQQKGDTLKILMGSFLVQMNYNYSAEPSDNQQATEGYGLKNVYSLTSNGNCIDAKPISRQNLIVALCWRMDINELKVYYLSLLSTASYKGFVVEQTPLNFENDVNQVKLLLKDQIIVVYSSKLAMVFTLWEIEDRLQFVNLDQIDQQDISNTICSVSIINNSTKQDTPITSILYSLIATQCSSSLYYITFTLYLQTQQYLDDQGHVKTFTIPRLHVSNAQNINLVRLLSQNHIQTPSQAVIIQTLFKIRDDPLPEEYRYYLTVVFDKFHSYRFDMRMNNNNGIITALILDSIFLKFGAYQAISANDDDYLVIKYVLDNGRLDEMYSFYSQKYFSVNSVGMKQYHMFQVYSLRKFHSQIEKMDQVPWHMSGNKIIQFNNQHLEVIGITNMLRAHISGLSQSLYNETIQDLYTQNIIITANNPNSARSVTIKLSAIDKYELTTLEIILIVVGGLAILLFLIFMGRFAYRRYDNAKKMVQLTENFKAEDADLEDQQVNRISDYLINATVRESVEP